MEPAARGPHSREGSSPGAGQCDSLTQGTNTHGQLALKRPGHRASSAPAACTAPARSPQGPHRGHRGRGSSHRAAAWQGARGGGAQGRAWPAGSGHGEAAGPTGAQPGGPAWRQRREAWAAGKGKVTSLPPGICCLEASPWRPEGSGWVKIANPRGCKFQERESLKRKENTVSFVLRFSRRTEAGGWEPGEGPRGFRLGRHPPARGPRGPFCPPAGSFVPKQGVVHAGLPAGASGVRFLRAGLAGGGAGATFPRGGARARATERPRGADSSGPQAWPPGPEERESGIPWEKLAMGPAPPAPRPPLPELPSRQRGGLSCSSPGQEPARPSLSGHPFSCVLWGPTASAWYPATEMRQEV